MAVFITQGRYTSDAIKGMVANPENREKVVADLMEKAGAKVVALYFTLGEYDFLSISEAPSEEVMASALIAGAASGSVSHLRTSVAMTAEHAMKAFNSAGKLSKSFKPAGGKEPRLREYRHCCDNSAFMRLKGCQIDGCMLRPGVRTFSHLISMRRLGG